MMKNPIEECPPDDVITRLDLAITYNEVSSVWTVQCPQWRYSIQTKNLTRSVAVLLAEIEAHNDGDLGGFDWPSFAKREGIILLKPEHRPLPPAKQFGRRTIPDDGTRTPRVSLWQAP